MQIPINIPDDTIQLHIIVWDSNGETDVLKINSEQLDHYRKGKDADTDCAWRMP